METHRPRVPFKVQVRLEEADDRVARRRVGQMIDRNFEDLAVTRVPLPVHWPGVVADFVDVRNGPGEFGAPGELYKIRYRWDVPNTTSATVEWRFDDVVVFTHTLPAGENPYVELPEQAYEEEGIVGIVTADGGGEGLTAFLYYR